MLDVVRFWLDLGLDGFRLDAVPYLFERDGTNGENLPETHEYLRRRPQDRRRRVPRPGAARRGQPVARGRRRLLRRRRRRVPHVLPLPAHAPHVHGGAAGAAPPDHRDPRPDPGDPRRVPVGDLPAQPRRADPRDGHRRGAGLHVRRVRRRTRGCGATSASPAACSRCSTTTRTSSQLFHAMLFSMPGSPVLYYGDEIGMGDNIFLGDRDGVRTPMQWTPDRNGGFSTADFAQLYLPPLMDPVYGFQAVNVEAAAARPVVVPALAAPAAPGAPRAPGVRHRHASRCCTPTTRRCSPTSARDERRHRAVRQQPQPLPAALRADARGAGRHGAGGADRPGAVPAHRRAAVLRHPRARTASTGSASRTGGEEDRAVIDLDAPRRARSRTGCPTTWPQQRWAGAHDRPLRGGRAPLARGRARRRRRRSWCGAWSTPPTTTASRPAYQLFVGAAAGRRRCPSSSTARSASSSACVPGRRRRRSWPTTPWSTPTSPSPCCTSSPPTSRWRCAARSCSSTRTARWCSTRRRILKVFRRVEPGPNPDVEITRELADARLRPRAGRRWPSCAATAPTWPCCASSSSGATEGWAAGPHLGARPPRVAAAAGGVRRRPRARRRAARRGLGELHVGLAGVWGAGARRRRRVGRRRWRSSSTSAARAVPTDALAPASTPTRCAAGTGACRARRRRRAQIRIHGDLHLAQVIRVDDGWRVLDFEGEPARRRDDRFTASSPLRDVAGMLRSLHYAAATGLAEWDPDDEELRRAGRAPGRSATASAFLARLPRASRAIDALLPADPAAGADVLAAFELDKAVYELAYELGYRPDHVGIPLGGHRPPGRGRRRPVMTGRRRPGRRLPTADDLWLFGEGRHERLWEVLGAHLTERRRRAPAPPSRCGPRRASGPRRRASGPAGPVTTTRSSASTAPACGAASSTGIGPRTPYKYEIVGADGARPAAGRPDGPARRAHRRHGQHRVRAATRVGRRRRGWPSAAGGDLLRDRLSIYEVHLGSWRRTPTAGFLTYRELAPLLADHVAALGFTHVELHAGGRAPLRAVVGLPGHRLLRPDLALRRPRRLPLVRRPPAPARASA